MKETMVKDFQNKIINANQLDLLLINYEMLFVTIDEAINAIEADEKETFNKAMGSSNRLLRELSDNLDFNYNIAKELMAIYIFISKQLIDASISYKTEPLISAKELLNILYTGWMEASAKETDKKPMISNGQKVYAGLTYGKGTLNETVYQGMNTRGFKA